MKPEELLSHAGFVKSLARSLVLDENTAADLEQQAMLAALEHPPSRGKPIQSWFAKVTRNFAYRMSRGEARRKKYETGSPETREVTSPEQIAAKEEIRSKLIRAVLELKDPYRTAITLRYYDELPPREIAKHMDIPVGTVHTHLKRGLAQLRAKLDARHHDDRKKWMAALAPVAGVSPKVAPTEASAVTAGLVTGGVIMLTTKLKASLAILTIAAVTTALVVLYPSAKQEQNQGTVKRNMESSPALALSSLESEGDGRQDNKSESRGNEKVTLQPKMPSLEFSGEVRSKDTGHAVANARISIVPLPLEKKEPRTVTQSDEAGKFRAVVAGLSNRPINSIYIQINADDYMNLETVIPYRTGQIMHTCAPFLLESDELHKIRIVDEYDNPVRGATVALYKIKMKAFKIEKVSDVEGYVRFLDSELLWRDYWMNQMVLKASAQSMANSLSRVKSEGSYYSRRGILPATVVMKPADFWSGTVEDSETGSSIPGAEVSLNCWHLKGTEIDHVSVKTDGYGFFKIPFVNTDEPHFLSLSIEASGYKRKGISLKGKSLSLGSISLEEDQSNKHLWTFQAVNGNTDLPIENRTMTVNNEDVCTNESGCFSFLVDANTKNRLRISSKGYKSNEMEIHVSNTTNTEIVTIELFPLIREQLKIFLQDELCEPVVGAHARLCYAQGESTWNHSRFTDLIGMAVFDPVAITPAHAYVAIACPGYCSFRSEEFPLGEDEEKIRIFTLRRGMLYQNIKVVDSTGKPLSNAVVGGFYLERDGTEGGFSSQADANGTCNLLIPPFIECLIGIKDKPDTAIELSFEDVLENKEVILGYLKSYSCPLTVTGYIHDGVGNPVEGVRVYQYWKGKGDSSRYGMSEKDGFFYLPAFRKRRYQLSIRSHVIKGRYFNETNIPDVSAGAELNIILRSSTSVETALFALDMRYSKSAILKADVWLESEEGNRVYADQRIKKSYRITFIDVQPGKMRAVAKIGSDTLHSPFFELEQGKCVQVRKWIIMEE
jgi:RNA polymerase sigma-70 factor (ECF subfamily)